MKGIVILSTLIMVMVSCNHTTLPEIKFDLDTLNFGAIPKGDSAVVQFWFKNSGSADLRLINVGTSCNCSVVDFPKTPFAANGKGYITIKYLNSRDDQTGTISKTIVVESNSKPSIHILTLLGNVNP